MKVNILSAFQLWQPNIETLIRNEMDHSLIPAIDENRQGGHFWPVCWYRQFPSATRMPQGARTFDHRMLGHRAIDHRTTDHH